MSDLIKNERITLHFRTKEDLVIYLECVVKGVDCPRGVQVIKGHVDYESARYMEITYDSICDHSGFCKDLLRELKNE